MSHCTGVKVINGNPDIGGHVQYPMVSANDIRPDRIALILVATLFGMFDTIGFGCRVTVTLR